MARNKLLLPIIGLFAATALIGTTYSAWVFNNTAEVDNNVQVEIPT